MASRELMPFDGQGQPDAGGASADFRMNQQQVLVLLRLVEQRDSGVTQRAVAEALAISKHEARRCLRALKRRGLVGETIDEQPSTPGRRLFWLTVLGSGELQRLERAAKMP